MLCYSTVVIFVHVAHVSLHFLFAQFVVQELRDLYLFFPVVMTSVFYHFAYSWLSSN